MSKRYLEINLSRKQFATVCVEVDDDVLAVRDALDEQGGHTLCSLLWCLAEMYAPFAADVKLHDADWDAEGATYRKNPVTLVTERFPEDVDVECVREIPAEQAYGFWSAPEPTDAQRAAARIREAVERREAMERAEQVALAL